MSGSPRSRTIASAPSRAACASGSGLAEILMKERADRDPRRADIGSRSAGHRRACSTSSATSSSDGVSVLLSSHLLDRVQSVCDRVALFNRATSRSSATVPELGRQVLGGGFRGRGRSRRAGTCRADCGDPGRAAGRDRGQPTVCCCTPTATCGRKRPPRWSQPVGACCASRSQEPSLEAIYTALLRAPMSRRAPCGVKARPCMVFGVVMLKEIADHFTSILMVVLVVWWCDRDSRSCMARIHQIKEITAEDPFLFLRLFTARRARLPLVSLLSFLVPLMAIGLGFDAVNGEHNRRTLSRILSQPIYRDALLFGKFVGWAVYLVGQPDRAVAAGDRAWLARARSSAGCRGNGARPGLAGGDDRLCRRLVRARAVVLDRVPLGGDGGAGRARAVAVRDHSLAAVLAALCRMRSRPPGMSWAC